MSAFHFKSIRARLIIGYAFIVCISVLFFQITLTAAIHNYYVNSITSILKNQALLSSTFFHEYIDNPDIYTQRQTILRSFSANSKAQVQLFEANGNILADTLPNPNNVPLFINSLDTIRTKDSIVWTSQTTDTKNPLLGITIPLYSNQDFIGYARFITSMVKTKQAVINLAFFLLLVGLVAILISIGIGLQISKSLSVPISNITHASRKMSNGDYSVRISNREEDEIGELGQTFNQMAKEIQDKEEIKNHFISSISHDLRTPLTSIKGWAITLQTPEDLSQEEIVEGNHIIEKECDRLSEMVNRLLDFSRLSPKKIQLSLEKVDLKKILHDSISFIKPSLKDHQLVLQTDISNNPAPVIIDPFYIKRVFDNILDNAVKYSSSNQSIEVSLQVLHSSIQVNILDSGEGIPDKDLPFVKLKFYQGSNKRKGSGMGLAICDEIMELHNGTLTIDNHKKGGVLVCLTFPKSD